jgi:hypothetical protein
MLRPIVRQIEDIAFIGSGCAISQASCSFMTYLCQGVPLTAALLKLPTMAPAAQSILVGSRRHPEIDIRQTPVMLTLPRHSPKGRKRLDFILFHFILS